MSPDAIISWRFLRANPTVVFQAFSDPDALAGWWGPAGFTNSFETFDLRPGGVWRFVMRGPDGAEHRMEKEFVEVVPSERIVLRHLEPPHHRFRMEMSFAEEEGGTRLTWRMDFESAEEAASVRELVLAANEQNFDRLEAHLAEAAAGSNAGRATP